MRLNARFGSKINNDLGYILKHQIVKLFIRIKYFKQQKNRDRGAAGLLAVNIVCPADEMIRTRN